jgi:hypothetical protein
MGNQQSMLENQEMIQEIKKSKQKSQQKKQEIINKALELEHEKNKESLSKIDYDFSEKDLSKLVLLPHNIVEKFCQGFEKIEAKVVEYKKKLIHNVIHQAQQEGLLQSTQKKLNELSPKSRQRVQKKIKQQEKKQKQLQEKKQDNSLL